MGKKIIALVLCITMLASLTLTGCSTDSADGQEELLWSVFHKVSTLNPKILREGNGM